MDRRRFGRLSLQLLGASAWGCSGTDMGSSCGRFVEGDVRVLTWLGASGDPVENSALQIAQQSHEECNPRSRVIFQTEPNRDTVMALLRSEQADDDVAIVNADRAIIQMCEEGKLLTLDGFERQFDSYATRVKDSISLHQDALTPQDDSAWPDRRLCIAPIAQHQLNKLYINMNRLPAGLDPKVWGTLDGFIQNLKGSYPGGNPLFTVASQDGWTLSLTLFENLMVATTPDQYEDFWLGRSLNSAVAGAPPEPDLQALEATMAQADLLWDYFDSESDESEKDAWEGFTRDERGAFYIMGNWRDRDADEFPQIVSMDFPGTQNYSVFNIDGLVVPANARNPLNGLGFIRTVTDQAVNADYNQTKGSNSLLATASDSAMGGGRTLLRSLPLLTEPGRYSQLESYSRGWLKEKNSEQLIEYVREHYPPPPPPPPK